MDSNTKRLALVVPASNTVMEPDFHRSAAGDVIVSTWRIHLDSVTREAEERMLAEELPRCLAHIEPTEPDLVVFGCTSAGALDGLEHDSGIARRIADATGAAVVTVVGSMVAELAAVAPQRVAVLTPYVEDLTRGVARCVEQAGYEIALADGMGIEDNREVGAVTPSEIAAFVRSRISGVPADAVFLSCTNWRALEAVGPLTAELGLPVLSSNQVTLAAVGRVLGS